MIFNILDDATELWMRKDIISEFFSSSGATLYKKLSDKTVTCQLVILEVFDLMTLYFPGTSGPCGSTNCGSKRYIATCHNEP